MRLYDSVNMTALFVKFVVLQKVSAYIELQNRLSENNAGNSSSTSEEEGKEDTKNPKGVNYERLLTIDDGTLFALRLFYCATVMQALAFLRVKLSGSFDISKGNAIHKGAPHTRKRESEGRKQRRKKSRVSR